MNSSGYTYVLFIYMYVAIIIKEDIINLRRSWGTQEEVGGIKGTEIR